jgi:mRNA interferase HigB
LPNVRRVEFRKTRKTRLTFVICESKVYQRPKRERDGAEGNGVRVISMKKLREFWADHPKTEEPLSAWYRVVEKADWLGPNSVRNTYRSADPIGDEFVVFNICFNDYRLVVRVDYARSIVYIWGVYTHAAYDELDLQAIDKKLRQERKKSQAKRSR